MKRSEKSILPLGSKVRYLYEDGELEGVKYGGQIRKRATDPIWSTDIHTVMSITEKKNQPLLYYLNDINRNFVIEELQTITT